MVEEANGLPYVLALAGQYDPAGTLATPGQLGAVRAQCPGLSRQR